MQQQQRTQVGHAMQAIRWQLSKMSALIHAFVGSIYVCMSIRLCDALCFS